MTKHKSWLIFEPKKGEDLKNNDTYYERIIAANSEIPKEIVHQWIFPHYNDANSCKNYSWIDLDSVEFNLVEKPTEFFEELNIINDNEEMVNNYSVDKFASWHRRFWKENGTWETSPIIINVNSFADGKPKTAELEGNYQLVEGHNRLGTLKLLIRDGRIPVAKTHKVWVLSKKQSTEENGNSI